ncbi:MAG: TetR/AcrR family transcriptional regulator [Candidatus Saccharibacteria bacterium]|nr:TetR/AcrR family transcriptional regulator [Moraxellaceae bacterium]
MNRRKPSQKRAKNSVEAIINAGFISLAKNGLANTTTIHIADIAGISPGTLYQYFDNKEAVYTAMERYFVNDILALLNSVVPEFIQLDIRAGVTFLLHKLSEKLLEDNGRYLKFARHGAHIFDENLSQHAHEIEKKLQEIIMQYVMHHPELMRIKSIPTFNYLIINGGILIIIRYLSESSPTISLEQLIDGLGNMAIRYIAGEMQDA